MSDNLAKTISTCAVWAATASIFIFGINNFSWTDIISGLLVSLIAVSLAIAPAAATQAIWNRPSTDADSSDLPIKRT